MRNLGRTILSCLAIGIGVGDARADGLPRLKATWQERDACIEAFSPDGRSVVTSGRDGFQLRDAETGRVRVLLNPPPFVKNKYPAFTPEGLLALAPSDRYLPLSVQDLKAWEVATGKLRGTIPYVTEVTNGGCGFALSGDGKLLAFVENSDRLPPQLKTSKIVTFSGPDPVEVTFNANPGLPRVKIWDIAAWKEIATIEGREPLAFSEDGKLLATGDRNWETPIAKLWDAKTGRLVSELRERPPGLSPLAFSPDGRFLATDGPEEKSIWEVATGRRWAIAAKGSGITHGDLRFSPDGKFFFPKGIPWIHPDIGPAGEYYCFDISRMPPKRVDLGTGEIIISTTGNWCATVQGDREKSGPRTIILREFPTLREIGRFDVAGLDGAGPSPDGRWLALHVRRHDLPTNAEGHSAVEIRLADPAAARVTATIPSPDQIWGGFQWKFSPDGNSLAVTYRTGSNIYRPGEPSPSDRPMNVEIWELPRR